MRREVVLWSCVTVLILGSMAWAQEPRPYLGVNLDSSPLPELLTKHLRLDPGQGIRINNIMVDSPADKAGLERDDIVAAFDGQKITGQEQFITAVRKAEVGATVSLDVIHLGQRQKVEAKLGPAPETVRWKYPPEPDVVTSWRPGRIFRIGPNGQNMMEIPFDKIPGGDFDVKKFIKESYTYRHSTGGEDYTITVEGDPAENDSQVIVHAGDQTYSTTVGKLDSLPEQYREAAAKAVEDSRNNTRMNLRIEVPEAFRPRCPPQVLPEHSPAGHGPLVRAEGSRPGEAPGADGAAAAAHEGDGGAQPRIARQAAPEGSGQEEHESGGPDVRTLGAQGKRSHLTAMEIYLQGTGSREDRSLSHWVRDIVIDILPLREYTIGFMEVFSLRFSRTAQSVCRRVSGTCQERRGIDRPGEW